MRDRPARRRTRATRAAGLIGRALALPAALLIALPPGAAEAGRRVIIADGTAGPSERAAAAMMALFPVVAVVVFALARLIDPPRE